METIQIKTRHADRSSTLRVMLLSEKMGALGLEITCYILGSRLQRIEKDNTLSHATVRRIIQFRLIM